MYITEQYKLYRFAYELINDHQYELIHLNAERSEIWLEKYVNKKSKVVRLVHKEFDWKNHLKADIVSVFQRVKALSKILVGKSIEVYNIYVSPYEPIDDWEELLKPMKLKDRKSVKMKVFYLSSENSEDVDENERIVKDLSQSFITDDELPPIEEQEQRVNLYKVNLSRRLYLKNKERENVFTYGKPFFTYILLALNIFMFIMLEMNGSSLDIHHLIKSGAKYNPAIIDGEWWRIISSMFLHIGIFHLFMNMLALYYLGMTVERIYGSARFLFIYFLAGIGGGLVSFAFSISVSAGASGALFGLFGALLFFGLIHKRLFFQTMGRGVLIIVAINIVFGFLIPQVDMGAHLGGLIFGFIAAAIVHLPNNKHKWLQRFSLVTYIILVLIIGFYGVNTHTESPELNLIVIEELNINEQYEEAAEKASTALQDSNEFEAEILFQRAYSYIQLGQIKQAITDLEKSIDIDPEIAEAHYNLAILYYEEGQLEHAKTSIIEAKRLKTDKKINELYNELME